MERKSTLDTIADTYLTIVYVLPIMIIVLALAFGYQAIYMRNVKKQHEDEKNIIFLSDYEDKVYSIAKNIYNKEEFTKIKLHETDYGGARFYSVEIEYYFSNPNKSVEEYDALIKNEVTNLYNSLKDKKVICDSAFANNVNKSIGMVFYYPVGDDYHSLVSTALRYTEETGLDEEIYQKIIEAPIITQEDLNSALEASE